MPETVSDLPALAPYPEQSASLLAKLEHGGGQESTSLIDARDDASAVLAFLAEHDQSPHTQRSYRKELERLLLWSHFIARKSFLELKRDDLDDLRRFLSAPPEDWIANNRARRGSSDWRPFRGPLTAQSIRHAELVFTSCFSWLVDARYLPANPFALVRRKGTKAHQNAAHRSSARRHQLGPEAISFFFRWIDAQRTEDGRPTLRSLRFVAMVGLYLQTGARRSEIAAARSSSIELERGRWWIEVTKKGGELVRLPLGDDAMAALGDYRAAHGLTRTPEASEDLPLLSHLRDHEKALTHDQVANELKDGFLGAAQLAEQANDLASAAVLKQATTHWLRHTAVGHIVSQTGQLVLAQQLAKHASINTTAGYATQAEDSLHDQVTPLMNSLIRVARSGGGS